MCASDGDEKEGAKQGASRHAGQHGQPGVDVQESRPMEGGRRAISKGIGDLQEGARQGASFHAGQHEQPCLHIEGTWPKCGSYQTNGEMSTVANAGLRC